MDYFELNDNNINTLKLKSALKKVPSGLTDNNIYDPVQFVKHMVNHSDYLGEQHKLIKSQCTKIFNFAKTMMEKHLVVPNYQSVLQHQQWDDEIRTYRLPQALKGIGYENEDDTYYDYMFATAFDYAALLYAREFIGRKDRDSTLVLLGARDIILNYSLSEYMPAEKFDSHTRAITDRFDSSYGSSTLYLYSFAIPHLSLRFVDTHRTLFNAFRDNDIDTVKQVLV